MGTVETSETSQPYTPSGRLSRALTALTTGALTFAGATGGFFLKNVPMAWLIIGFPLLVGVIFYVCRSMRMHGHPLAIDPYRAEP
jgi:hypothetical protein